MGKKTVSILLIFALMLGLLLIGCSSSPLTNKKGRSESADIVTVKFMHLWPARSSKQHNMIVNDIVAEYEKINPHVKIEQEMLSNEQYKEKLKIVTASNELPDVGMTWAAGFLDPYVKGNKFATLDDLLEDELGESFISGTTEAYAVDGKTYGLPLELNIAPVFYNKRIFNEYNLEIPKTYEEFREIVNTLIDNDVAPITIGNKDRWSGSLWYMYLADRIGGPETVTNAINRSGTFENPALIQAAEEIQKLVDIDAFVKGYNGLSNDEAKALFTNEQAAMYLMATWELPNFTTNEDVSQKFRDSVDFFKFPTVEAGKGDFNSFVGGPGVGLFVSENSKVKEEAKKFIQFFVGKWGERSVTDAGVIPATKVDTSKLELPQMYIDILDQLNNASNITLYADVQMGTTVAEEHLNLIQALFGGAITPEEFAKRHEEILKVNQ